MWGKRGGEAHAAQTTGSPPWRRAGCGRDGRRRSGRKKDKRGQAESGRTDSGRAETKRIMGKSEKRIAGKTASRIMRMTAKRISAMRLSAKRGKKRAAGGHIRGGTRTSIRGSVRGRNRRKAPAIPNTPGRMRAEPIANSEKPLVSVIVPAMNERRTIAAVIANARKVHPETEVIVVANGSTDGTEETARRMGARVISFPHPLGHDVGRCIGARHAKGDILLFTDGDIVIPADRLRPFVEAVMRGCDVALNRYSGKTRTGKPHPVVIAKHALNAALRRRDLTGSSMTTIPHAISRRMLESVGAAALAVPPVALASAVRRGLTVCRAAYVEVGKSNPIRRRNRRDDPLKRLIVGDHLEALARLTDEAGPRGGFTDLHRQRNRVR